VGQLTRLPTASVTLYSGFFSPFPSHAVSRTSPRPALYTQSPTIVRGPPPPPGSPGCGAWRLRIQAYPCGTAPSPSSSAPGRCSLMCSTKSVVAGHDGPSLTPPSNRATTRAAARSLVQGTSVKLVVPKELHSSMERKTVP
jgi:hypothetical protein